MRTTATSRRRALDCSRTSTTLYRKVGASRFFGPKNPLCAIFCIVYYLLFLIFQAREYVAGSTVGPRPPLKSGFLTRQAHWHRILTTPRPALWRTKSPPPWRRDTKPRPRCWRRSSKRPQKLELHRNCSMAWRRWWRRQLKPWSSCGRLAPNSRLFGGIAAIRHLAVALGRVPALRQCGLPRNVACTLAACIQPCSTCGHHGPTYRPSAIGCMEKAASGAASLCLPALRGP